MIAPIDIDCPRCGVKAKQSCHERVSGSAAGFFVTLGYHHAERVDNAARVDGWTHGRFPGVVTFEQSKALTEREDLAREALKCVAAARDLLSGSDDLLPPPAMRLRAKAQLESALDTLRKLIA